MSLILIMFSLSISKILQKKKKKNAHTYTRK
jgi:hypothetical protein